MGSFFWQQLRQLFKIVYRNVLGLTHHLFNVDFVLKLENLIYLTVLEVVLPNALDAHQVHDN